MNVYRMRRGWVVAVCLALAGPVSAQDLDGFLPARGEGAAALSFASEGYDEFWAGEQKVRNPGVGSVDVESWSLWGRYGLTDRLSLVGNVAYVNADSDGMGGFAESDLQDLWLLAQYRLAESQRGNGRSRWVGALGVRTPLSDYEANLPVDVGDGTTDLLLRLVWQWKQGAFHFAQQVGYDLRGEDAPDQFPLYTQVGYRVGRVTWIGYLQWLLASSGTDIGDPGFTFPSNEEEYQRLGLRAYAELSDAWGLTVGGFTTLDGRNTGDASGFFVGGVVGF